MYKSIKKTTALFLIFIMLFLAMPVIPVSAWGGPTHKNIPVWALEMIRNDKTQEFYSNWTLQKLWELKDIIFESGDDPDELLSDVGREVFSEFSIYGSHFYNPLTGRTYTTDEVGNISLLGVPIPAFNGTPQITALYQLKKYSERAIYEWKKGNYVEAAYLLGYSTHFMADPINPHHAALKTVGCDTKTHAPYEDYVDAHLAAYKIDTINPNPNYVDYTYNQALSQYANWNDFLKGTLDYYATSSYYKYDTIRVDSEINYNSVASTTVPDAERALALMLYRFTKEVEMADKKLTIKVKTADDVFAGTDDDVYFGMETSDGKTKEILMDNIAVDNYDIDQINDFEQDSWTTFEHYFYDSSFDFSKVTRAWLRKDCMVQDVLHGDDWRIGTVEIYTNDQLVYSNTLNTWLNDSTRTKYFDVPGGLVLQPGVALGQVDLTVKTSDDLFAGTDNDIFFGIVLQNGMKLEFPCDANYNDFEAGVRSTYSFNIRDTRFQPESIKEFYFRKHTNVTEGYPINDDWKVESLAVKMKGKTAYATFLNRLIDGDDTTYSWNVQNAVSTSNPYVGYLDTTIKTSTSSWSGTDSDVYLGINYNYGGSEYLLDHNWVNDFEAGSNRTYTVMVPRRASEVKSVYIRKYGSDDWKMQQIVITLNAKTIVNQTVNMWFDSNSDRWSKSVNLN